MHVYRRQVAAGILFISLVLIAVVIVTGKDALLETLERFPPAYFIPIFALKLVNWALRYYEWRYFLGVIGVRTSWRGPTAPAQDGAPPTIREWDSVILWLAGMTLTVSPGKLAEVLKSLVLKHLTGVEFSRSAPVVFMERLVDGLAVIVLAGVALGLTAGSLVGTDVSTGYAVAVLVGTTAALSAGIALVQVRPLALAVIDRTAGWPLIGRFNSAIRTLYESSYDLLKLRHLGPMTLVGIGAYFCDSVGFYLLLRGLGVAGSPTLFAQAVFILGFSVIVAALSAMPGGAGGREITVGALLTGVVGLSRADAGTATFLISLFQVWVGVLVGLVVIALFRRTLFPPALNDEIVAYQAAQQSQAKSS
jgi:uncharacterized protein (TIRG00374 family)